MPIRRRPKREADPAKRGRGGVFKIQRWGIQDTKVGYSRYKGGVFKIHPPRENGLFMRFFDRAKNPILSNTV